MLRKITLYVILFLIIGVCAYSQTATPTPLMLRGIKANVEKLRADGKDIDFKYTDDLRGESIQISSDGLGIGGMRGGYMHIAAKNVLNTTIEGQLQIYVTGNASIKQIQKSSDELFVLESPKILGYNNYKNEFGIDVSDPIYSDTETDRNVKTKNKWVDLQWSKSPRLISAPLSGKSVIARNIKRSFSIDWTFEPNTTHYFRIYVEYDRGDSGNFDIVATDNLGNMVGHLDPWYGTNYLYQQSLTVNSASVAQVIATTNVIFVSQTIDSILPSGNDIIFTDAGGWQLNIEKVAVDNIGGGSYAVSHYVQLASLQTDTKIFCFWSNSTATVDPSTSAIWSASDYVGVWHFEGNANDSTVNGLNLTGSGSPTYIVNGIINNTTGANIAGNTQYFSHLNDPAFESINGRNYTMIMWFRTIGALDNFDGLYTFSNGGGWADGWGAYVNSTVAFRSWVQSYTTNFVQTSGIPSTSASHLWITSYNGTHIKGYLDGVQYAEDAYANPITYSASNTFYIGSNASGLIANNIYVDEVRLLKASVSSGEVQTMHNAEYDSFGFWTRGNVEIDPGAPTPTATQTPTITPTPTVNPMSAKIRILNITTEYLEPNSITVPLGSEVYFDSGQSSSTAGPIHNTSIVSLVSQPIVLWDFGDGYKMDSTNQGTYTPPTWTRPNWSTEMVTHFYMTAGVYSASMTIWDVTGNIDQATCQITVTGETPMTGFEVLRPDFNAHESMLITVIVPSSEVGSATKLHVTLSNNKGDFTRTLVDHRTIASTTETFVLYNYTLPADEYYIEYQILNNEDVVSTGGYFKEYFKKWVDGKQRISIDHNNSIYRNGEPWFSTSVFLQDQTTMFYFGQDTVVADSLTAQQNMDNYDYTDYLEYMQTASTIPMELIGPLRWEGSAHSPVAGGPANYGNPNTAQAIITAASRVNNKAMWTWADEPTLPYGAFSLPIAAMQYRALNFLSYFYDGIHPTLLNHYGMPYLQSYDSSRDNTTWDFATNGAVFGRNITISSIIMADRYPYELGSHDSFDDPARSSLDLDVDAVRRYQDTFELNMAPNMMYVEADEWQDGDGEGVTPAQLKSLTWLYVIHGIKGLNWFALNLDTFLPGTEWTYEAERAKNEVTRWQIPIMTWSDAQPVISDATTRADRVDAKAWREGNNIYMVAARLNAATYDLEAATYPEPANVNAGLTISGLDGIYAVNVLDETREITMSAPGVFNDDFGLEEYHFYQIVIDATEAAGIPSIISMTTGTIESSLTPTFTWSASGTVTISTYEIQIAEDVNFGTGVINDASITATSYTPPFSLTDGSSYFWRVRAHAQDYYHFSEWSDPQFFTLNTGEPTSTPTQTPTETPTPTNTATNTPAGTATNTPTPIPGLVLGEANGTFETDLRYPIKSQSGWIFSSSHTVQNTTSEWMVINPVAQTFSIEVSSATGQVTGTLGNVTIEVIGSANPVKTDTNQIGLPLYMATRQNAGDTYSWTVIPNITSYGIYSFPIHGIKNVQLRITNLVGADSVSRIYRCMAR